MNEKVNNVPPPLATLTPEEAKNAMVFLNRVDLKGSESEAHAALKFKLGLIMKGQPMPAIQSPKVTDLEDFKESNRE